jgi:hypothetical protein
MLHRSIFACCVTLGAAAAACGGGEDRPPPAPVLGAVSVTTAEDTATAVTVVVTAADVAAVTLTVATPPSHGTLTGTGPTWTYTPAANYAGPDSAIVGAADSHGSGTATISVTVTAVDDAPVADPDAVAAGHGAAVTIAQTMLLANDSDVDSTALSVTGVGSPEHGTVALAGNDVVFTPDAGFDGVATFHYTVSDGTLTAEGSVSVSVAADQGAVADVATVAEGSTANSVDVLANDLNSSGTKRVASVTPPAHGVAAVGPDGGSVTYTPAAGYCNQMPNTLPDTFTYSVAPGGDTAAVAVRVTCACGLDKSTSFVVGSN